MPNIIAYTDEFKKQIISTIEVIQIGYFENRKEEIQAIRMPKTVEKVPKNLFGIFYKIM